MAGLADIRLTSYRRPVFKLRREPHIGNGRGVNVPFAGKDLRRKFDSLGKIAGDLGESGEKQVSKTVTAELSIAPKAMFEQSRQQPRILAQRDHAVAYVAR